MTITEAPTRRLTTSKAMVEAIAQEMERDESVFYLGEDVGAYGGIFGSTTGLLEQFGPQWRGAPPAVPAAVIAWLVSEDAARAWHGRTVYAQKLCEELALVPGWPV